MNVPTGLFIVGLGLIYGAFFLHERDMERELEECERQLSQADGERKAALEDRKVYQKRLADLGEDV